MIENNYDNIDLLNKPQKIFYRAVIENNNDGKAGNKVQVRILGIHSEKAKDEGNDIGVPVEKLPWAEVMYPADNIGGIGTYGKTGLPLNGTWVWVFFDGGDWNKPIVLGTSIVKGNEPKDTKTKGFQDPNGVYPEKDKLEMGTTRLSANRNVSETGIIKVKDANRDIEIPTALPNTRYDELKEQTTSAKYPHNETQAYTDGSFFEHDVTNGGRTHWYHSSGTYTEVVPDGSHTINVVKDQTTIVYENAKRYIKNNETHTVQGNSLYKVDVNRTIIVGGSSKETVNGGVQEFYNAGQSTNGGPEIRLEAGMIYLN